MRLSRILKLVSLLVFGALLAGCGLVEGDGRHNQPLSSVVEGQLRNMGSDKSEAMLIRIYKDESALEVWKRVKGGTYKYFKSYEICSWSGELGPKIREGDRQAPEGFYSITPGLMNPRSNYYLAFNTGFPNKFDRVHGRTGSDLMVHGDCSSRGCYAMTDEQIAEIYALGREAFKGGQRTFELQIFPFRMTAANLAKHRNSPHIDFWRNLKEGYDAFEISRQVPKWDVCEKRYIFNAAGGPLNAAGACPTASTHPELMAKVKAKQIADEATFQTASADLAAKEARKAEAEAERAAREAAIAERSAAVSEAVEERTEAISGAVGGFFSGITGLFGAGRTETPANVVAPTPAPRTSGRG
ncbi:L,D-transpeptidase family protein [Mariluticola halotolerans]|uniref:L,D-transpeptidase family protein n=1 Tax=Mariluticola halotolerans TaxID=2909283 RepID=UPI0034A0BEB5